MGILDSILADDLATLTDPDFFGETVTYTDGVGGSPVQIQGVAVRKPLTGNGEARAAVKLIDFQVSANASIGIPTKPVRNKGTITIAWMIGDTPTAFLIVDVLEQDAGGWMLKLKG